MARSIKVLYFASAKEALGVAQETVNLPDELVTLADLPKLLIQLHPDKAAFVHALRRSALSLNEELILRDDEQTTPLATGDTVAIIPPVSGG
jgi:molybdopterin converting factor subunit 1